MKKPRELRIDLSKLDSRVIQDYTDRINKVFKNYNINNNSLFKESENIFNTINNAFEKGQRVGEIFEKAFDLPENSLKLKDTGETNPVVRHKADDFVELDINNEKLREAIRKESSRSSNSNDSLDDEDLFDEDDMLYGDEEYPDVIGFENEIVEEALGYLKELNIPDCKIEHLYKLFYTKFPHHNISQSLLKLRDIKPFKVGGNVFEDSDGIDDPTLFVMRWVAGIKFEEVLDILKFDLSDSNLVQDLSVGNIGTAQRWTKTVTGSNVEDDSEIMCGRYTKRPRLATFPNKDAVSIPITKRVDIASTCSHHFLPYGSLLRDDSYAIISYVPNEFVLGISKLQRLADWVARRPTIQEDLVKTLWKAVSEAAQTEDVYVGLFNARHTCEYLRGSQSHDGAFTTEYYKGKFESPELRKQVTKQ